MVIEGNHFLATEYCFEFVSAIEPRHMTSNVNRKLAFLAQKTVTVMVKLLNRTRRHTPRPLDSIAVYSV
jgi:hypothetical protein